VGKYGYVLVIAAIVLLGAYGALRTPATHGSAGKYIRVNGIMYAAQLAPEVVGLGRIVQATDLGAEFAHIPHDEFPSLLRAGTPVFTVRDYLPHVRLAAFQADELILFEAWNNPAAHHGSDLLDLRGKVSSIGILDDQTDTQGMWRSPRSRTKRRFPRSPIWCCRRRSSMMSASVRVAGSQHTGSPSISLMARSSYPE
jgi:hypothetical protein